MREGRGEVRKERKGGGKERMKEGRGKEGGKERQERR